LPRYERLDVVIIMVGASNVLRWLEEGAPSDRPASTLPDTECFAWQPAGPFSWHPKRTATAELARRLRLRVLRPIEEKTRAGRFMTRARAMRARAKLTGQFSATVGDPSAMLDAWDRSLRDALVSAMLRGDRVILARQPWFDKPSYSADEEAQFWHGGFGDAYEVEVTRFCSSETLAQLMAQIDGRATKVAEELGVEHVNLRAILEPTLTDYYDQYHFTAKGAAKLAAALASVLLHKAASTTTQHAAAPTSTRTDGGGIRGGSARNAGVAGDALGGSALSEDSGRIAPH
jgi:hypothetical protein